MSEGGQEADSAPGPTVPAHPPQPLSAPVSSADVLCNYGVASVSGGGPRPLGSRRSPPGWPASAAEHPAAYLRDMAQWADWAAGMAYP